MRSRRSWPLFTAACGVALRRRDGQGDAVAFEKHVLVDGANVMYAWPALRALLRSDRDLAREQLVRAATVLHDAEQCRVTVVFDGRGAELSVRHPSGEATLTVIHTTAAVTADDVIEQMVGQSRQPRACVVITADAAERACVTALGADVLAPADLAEWVARAEGRVSGALRRLQAEGKERRR